MAREEITKIRTIIYGKPLFSVPLQVGSPDMANQTRNTVRLVIIPTALRERRLRAFLSPEQLAENSTVGVGTIKAAEGSPKSVHLSTVEKLATALKCLPSDIAQVENSEAAS